MMTVHYYYYIHNMYITHYLHNTHTEATYLINVGNLRRILSSHKIS